MDKIRDIKQYIDTVKQNNEFFKKYYYHSLIDLNLVKLDLILKNGILSKKLIQERNLVTLYTHHKDDFDSKNGIDYISLTKYLDNCSFTTMFESFSFHTLTSLSLLVDKNIEISEIGEKQTYFDDEIFCKDSISNSCLEGIILPEYLSNLPINKVNCLPDDLYCYTTTYINNWIYCIQNYFGNKLSPEEILNIKQSHKQLWEILENYERPERWVTAAIQSQRNKYGIDFKDVLANILQKMWERKLDITNPRYIEVINIINKDKLPIYEIKEKCLKKIN